MSFLAAFGETRVHIESTNSPIRVTRAAKEQDAKDINRQRVIKSHKCIKHRLQIPIKDHKNPSKVDTCHQSYQRYLNLDQKFTRLHSPHLNP